MPFRDEELALIDAIHADPRNDAPRLAYADWLEEHGNPIGELMRWQVATRRCVYASVGRNGLKNARIMDRRRSERGKETSDAPFDQEHLERHILPEADKWIRPFPRGAARGMDLNRGIPCVGWEQDAFDNLTTLHGMCARLLPRMRLQSGIIHLNREPFDEILAHPVLRRINQLGIRMFEPRDVLLEFIAKFADSSLPDRIEWLSLLGHAATPLIDDEVLSLADEKVGRRMAVMTVKRAAASK